MTFESGPWRLYSEFPIAPDVVLDQCSQVEAELASLTDLKGKRQPVEILLFQSRASYLQYVNRSLPQARYRKALYFRNGSTSQLFAYRSSTLIVDLRHEFAHAVLHQNLAFLPLWIDEGFAEYVEEPPEIRDRNKRLRGVRWHTRLGSAPDLRELEELQSAEAMQAHHYRAGWAWIDFLVRENPAGHSLLKQYLHQIAAGEAPDKFSRRLYQSHPQLAASAYQHFR